MPWRLIGLTVLLATAARAGDIYVGTDANGVITFTDVPPQGDASFSLYLKDIDDRPKSWASIDTRLLKKNLDAWDPLVVSAARRFELRPELIKAVMLVESGMNPRAKSPVGAQGLMQLMPATAEGLGVTDAWDPEQNVHGGARYLRRMLDRFGELQLALAAYNAGPGNVERYGGVPPFEETRLYVQKVSKYYNHFLTERPLAR